jgi:hypothetical protein
MDFWNDVVTDRSWKVLIDLKGKFNFVLIGGWACYLLTGAIKSKDIDIIIDFNALEKIKAEFMLKKNPHLKKYGTVIDGISIDVYVPFYSRLAIPIEFVLENTIEIQGLRIPKPEILLILKQQAEDERKYSVKGQKDRVDVINILLNSDIEIESYRRLIKRFSLGSYEKRLKEIVNLAKREFEYLGITNPREIKLKKRKILDRF